MNTPKHRRSEEIEPWEELSVRLQRHVIIAQDAADQSVEYLLMPGADTPQPSTSADDGETTVGVQASSDGPSTKKSKGGIVHHLVIHEKPLGKGGFGVVYRASKIEQGNQGSHEICLKHARERSYDTLIQENEIFDHLHNHPHDSIIRRLFLCNSRSDTFLGLECFEGYNLSEIMAVHKYRKKNIKHKELVSILKQQVDAILHLQNYGIFHCDIKPENILYNSKRQTSKLIDFGLAMIRNGVAESFKSHGGTTEYMAPETLMDGYLCIGTDLYSLGATLSHLITLEVPWHCLDDVKVLYAEKIDPNMPNTEQLKQQRRKDVRIAIKAEIERYRMFMENGETLMSIQRHLHFHPACEPNLKRIVLDMLSHNHDSRPTCKDLTVYLESLHTEILHRDMSTMSVNPPVAEPTSSISNIAVLTNGIQGVDSTLSVDVECPAVLADCETTGATTEMTSAQLPAIAPNFSMLNKPSSRIYQPDEEKPPMSTNYAPTDEMRSTAPSESVHSEVSDPSGMNDYLMASNEQSSNTSFSMPRYSEDRPMIPKFESDLRSSTRIVEADGDPGSPSGSGLGPAGMRSPVDEGEDDEDL